MNAQTLMRRPLLSAFKAVEAQVKLFLGVLAICPAALALFFRFFTALPRVPLLEMLGFSAACALLLVAYSVLMRGLSH